MLENFSDSAISALSTFVIGLIGFFTALVGFIPSTGKVYDDSNYISQPNKPYYKRIKKRGWITLSCIVIGILLSVVQSYLNEVESDRKDIVNIKKDSLSKEELKSYSIRTIDTLSTTLGRYGFKLDSTNNLVKILGDSVKKAKTQIIVTNKPIPYLQMCLIEKSQPSENEREEYKEIDWYYFRFCSHNIESKIIEMETHVIIVDTLNRYKYIMKIDLLPKNSIVIKFTSDGANQTALEKQIYLSKKSPRKAIFVLLRGSYGDIDGENIHYIEDVYVLNENIIGSAIRRGFGQIFNELTKKSVIQFIDENKEK
jgi:uncharacterized protein (UPF0297 family)